jgi:hypothetical protein
MTPAGQRSVVIPLFSDERQVAGSPATKTKKTSGSGQLLSPIEFNPAEFLGKELDRLENWPPGTDTKKAEVYFGESVPGCLLEIRCARPSGISPFIVDAKPVIEIAGREELGSPCAFKKIVMTANGFSIFVKTDDAINYRPGLLDAFPAVRFVSIDLPKPRRIVLANVHFDRRLGDLRK